MLTDQQVIDIVDNSDQNRFELRLSGDLVGILGYFDLSKAPAGTGFGVPPTRPAIVRKHRPVVSFMHTVIVEDFGHRGLAGVMVGGALDLARRYGWQVQPVCKYVQRFVSTHPEYRDLIAPVAR
ncbi:acetyltransferase [Rhodococcus sp. WMMA185]|uniref:GNAT family N-acetyltransferase n=1 Tax=Rhodococcus sp. WMMA185 TaxID=679318 RepID=UPI00087871B5|nr:GNAT family N-acetyltransferase [Rhodococcus sp. WMMA185]AOW93285.1 acetyltransferase [Rhodococcus sp. WMMA185]